MGRGVCASSLLLLDDSGQNRHRIDEVVRRGNESKDVCSRKRAVVPVVVEQQDPPPSWLDLTDGPVDMDALELLEQ